MKRTLQLCATKRHPFTFVVPLGIFICKLRIHLRLNAITLIGFMFTNFLTVKEAMIYEILIIRRKPKHVLLTSYLNFIS